ncbi:exodeoxyribonuclease VII small subunit [Adlercreutzia sp. R25]|uniref:Exodeoxyribonuclease VII small subunit n=1 Tax=Adlercreutzia shanghongiae TaxID=3111773 RepID=A0ABU6J0Y1_9ACTN|nr:MULTISPECIES: exodeoxyribonuclease VII small subunit [unclassified Adlercreutzia]MEC4273482.1 exodeoxyribonuclease VII small subunit [Adlercreutzia sp. R25]MEC4295743.1 exodeoxyribonuclease VII small subunit [Adlercreutzia sp. R22]
MADEQGRTFEDVHGRLAEIVDAVSDADISLDDALKLYEEAVKLGLSACDLSEQDLDAFMAAEEPEAEEASGVAAPTEEEADAQTPDAGNESDVTGGAGTAPAGGGFSHPSAAAEVPFAEPSSEA